MSQGDYIHYKKIATELRINKLSPVLPPNQYTSFLGYSIENKIINTKQVFDLLSPPPNVPIVYGIAVQDASGCPTFITCNNTNLRPNRVPNSGCEINPRPSRPLTVKQLAVPISKLPVCLCPSPSL